MVTYITKSDVLAWINIQLDNKATLSDIPDIILDMAHSKVVNELVGRQQKTIPKSDDKYHFLKFATMSFSLALLCKSRMITQSSGDVLRDRFGEVIHDYQRSNPLFFFAQGSSKQFMSLLPYETFRMYGYAYVDAYIRRYFYETTGYYNAQPKIAVDNTYRGYNWDDQGDYDEEETDTSVYSSGTSDSEDDIEHHDVGL